MVGPPHRAAPHPQHRTAPHRTAPHCVAVQFAADQRRVVDSVLVCVCPVPSSVWVLGMMVGLSVAAVGVLAQWPAFSVCRLGAERKGALL